MPKTIHPTSRTLLAYLDGELEIDERCGVQEHVTECESCREELDTMEADLDWFLVLEAASRRSEPAPPPGGLNRLLVAARTWQSEHPETIAACEENRRLVEQGAARTLEVLFGQKVAAAAQSQGGTAEALLFTFLGKRAADSLMMDIRRGNHPRLASDVS